MNVKQQYTEEFKLAAIKQITERGHPVAEVATRLGVSGHSLYAWIKRYSGTSIEQNKQRDQLEENRQLKAELKRVTEEHDILKKPPSANRKSGKYWTLIDTPHGLPRPL